MAHFNSGTASTINPVGSLLSADITVPTVVHKTIYPYANLLPAGTYKSKIIEVTDAVKDNIVIGIDCTHELVDCNGGVFMVSFRLFAPDEVNELMTILCSYGFTGNLADVLIGLKETVVIAGRSEGSKYMKIFERSLDNSAGSNAVSASYAPKKKSSFLKSKRRHQQQSKIMELVTDDTDDDVDDEWDEDEDYLTDDE